METTSSNGNTGTYNFMVQPFPIHFDSNDLHVIVFFEGHPEYEAIEAMIQEREGNVPYVRAIITRLDKTQIDHINDRNVIDWLKSRKRKREIHYTPINCNISGGEGKKRIVMSFTSYKGENIIVETSPASKASSKYAGLINPLGHSRYISLPVMYAEKSTLIGSKSRVCIDDEECKIPVKVRVPLFFKGMAGYHSELFNIGVIRAGMEKAILLESPDKFLVGKQWIYKAGNDTLVYEITKVDKSQITVRGRNDEVLLEQTEDGIAIRQVKVYSACKRYEAVFSIAFNPGIVIWITSNQSQAGLQKPGEFSIAINGYTSLITGIISSECGNGSVNMLLKPMKPDWAKERNVSLVISNFGNELAVNTEIL